MESTQSDVWHPDATIDIGDGCEVGVVIDDSCFVVLLPQTDGRWKPTHHVPPAAIPYLAREQENLLSRYRAGAISS